MQTDYELFLGGCYSAVVEIKTDNDLYEFIKLMKKLGFGKYAEYMEKINDEKDLIYIAKTYNNVKDLCIEYQIGKGFTFGDKQDYIQNCNETKILTITDLKKATGYYEDFKPIILSQMGDSELDILDDFCNMYDWLPVNSQYGFNILDTQCDNEIVSDEYYNFHDLINRIVGRAISYCIDEQDWEKEEEMLEYLNELLNIAKKYRKNDEYEDKWLEEIEKKYKKS